MRSDTTEATAAHEIRARPDDVSGMSPSHTASHSEDFTLQQYQSARPKDCTLI
jgi:hypothetical protein